MAGLRLIILISSILLSVALGTCYAAFPVGDSGIRVQGFLENDFGIKLGHDQTKRDNFNLFEQRLQLKTKFYPDWNEKIEDWMTSVEAKGDFTVDEYFNGRTDAQLRVLSIALSPVNWMDIKAGRQVFTWGTGEYLFINDLFPKDYISFYIGRDDEYLKKPSDGAKLSIYREEANLDLIIIPEFEPNTLFNGQRVSFFDSFARGIAGTNSDRKLVEPGQSLEETEFAARGYRNFNSYEAALYFFRGFYKSPRGYLNEINKELFYPRLDVYGASIRGPGAGGIINAEIGYYNSRQDTKGDNRLIENSAIKYMMGYSKDLGNDLNTGVQWLYEQTLNYDNYLNALLPQDVIFDEYRHLLTFRLTKLYKNQTVRANFFSFFSPTDKDGYIRPSVDYDISDVLKITLGANLSWGKDTYTEFGQTEHNKNIYTRLRYSF